jgi:predicted ATPase/DNA-binding XRE family transcriptional regulator
MDPTFGQWLKRERDTLGLTQAQLARRLACATVTLRKIESGDRRPSPEMVERLAVLFEVPPHERASFLRFARLGKTPAVSGAPPPVWRPRPNGTTLPTPASPFFGRSRELETAGTLLKDRQTHLLTLLGVGGIGKTRLALELAGSIADRYPDGVFFVDLAPFAHPAYITAAIAHALGIRATETLHDSLLSFLRGKRLLILLDNFEQLVRAAPLLAEILKANRRVKLIVTSRQPLHLPQEKVLDVPPLDTPEPKRLPTLSALAAYPAISLFVAHARAARPDFYLTKENARDVAQICRQLEGIPLALELAAARIKYLPLKQLASLLDQRFRLLRTDSEELPPRHRTLAATIDWSYDLLTLPERESFRRLAAFSGGWSLRAAERVCAGATLDASDVLHTLTQLADKSLIQVRPGEDEARFSMLETLREYAWEKLVAGGEEVSAQNAQLAYFSTWAGEITQGRVTDGERSCLFELERENIRRAFGWALVTGQFERGLVMVGTIWRAWSKTLHVNQYIPFFQLESRHMQELYEFARAVARIARKRNKKSVE